MSKNKITIASAIAVASAILLWVGLGTSSKEIAAAGPSGMPPMPVEVITVKTKDVPVYNEWIGTLDGMVNAEIRAQVSGNILKRNYVEGSFVRKGTLLFEIDARPFKAATDQAKGELAKAEGQAAQAEGRLLQANAQYQQALANQGRTQLDEDRYTPLAKQKAVTQQELDNAVQSNIASKAQVESAKAGIATAKAELKAAHAAIQAAKAGVTVAEINLGYTRITAPIDGIVGIAQAQVGNLVGPTTGVLTTVSTVDPIKSYFTLSESEYLKFTKENHSQGKWDAANKKLELELVLSDGSTYEHKGKFYIADREIDRKTGAIRLAGLFPNPGNNLRPGQYGRVRAVTGTSVNAIAVPQRSVIEMQGKFLVAVVGKGNKVEMRPVTAGEKIGNEWIIESGINPGDKIVTAGIQKIGPGSVVKPTEK